MEMKDKIESIQSGFPMLDLLAGGYPLGSVVVARYLGNEFQADILQDFMERQALNFALRSGFGKKVLLITFQMDEETAARSFLERKHAPVSEIVKSGLYIIAREKGRALPSPGFFLKTLGGYLENGSYDAVIVDAIDEIVPKDPERQSAVSAELLEGIFELTAMKCIPVIVTDYANVWDTDHIKYKDVCELELNEDVNGKVQASFFRDGRMVAIEDLFSVPESLGIGLVGAAVSRYRETGLLPEASDQLTALVNAGAAIICEIDKLLKVNES